MDFSSLIASHRLPANQIRFDQEAMERAILRAEERQTRRRALWSKISGFWGVVAEFSRFTTHLTTRKRPR